MDQVCTYDNVCSVCFIHCLINMFWKEFVEFIPGSRLYNNLIYFT